MGKNMCFENLSLAFEVWKIPEVDGNVLKINVTTIIMIT